MEDLEIRDELAVPSAPEENGSVDTVTDGIAGDAESSQEDAVLEPNGKVGFAGENRQEDVVLEANGKVGFEAVKSDDHLEAKLKLALKEIINKDNLVKQHAKVAEEAISGWEKAEAEAAAFKQQLDSALQQRLALEERVGHLDGALKECVKQMRSGREEQELKQEEHVKKAKEWDALRSELEAKLAEANLQVTNNASASEGLQQRISGLSESHAQAQTEAKRFSVKMEAVEKDNATLRHDVRMLKKELVALNGESKKAVDVVKQQNAEYSKKVSKLEAECQKLKGLLRKKAAASQARQDGGEVPDRRKSLGRLTSSPRADEEMSEISTREIVDEKFALEDETRTLKQVLEKKDKELQAARHLCARAASKLEETIYGAQDSLALASLSGHLETLKAFGSNQPSSIASQGSCNGEEVEELPQFRKTKNGKKPDKLLDTTSFELMDDFLEMEKLTSNLPHENGHIWENHEAANREGSPDSNCSEALLAAREKELYAANEMCKALHKKVTDLESQISNAVSPANGFLDHEKDRQQLSHILSESVLAMEALAKGTGAEHSLLQQPNGAPKNEVRTSGLVWSNAELDSAFKKMASVSPQEQDALQGFMVELVAALKVLGDFCTKSRSSDWNVIRELEEANALLESDMARLEGELVEVKASTVEITSRMQEAVDALKTEKMTLENRLDVATKTLSDKELHLSTVISKREAEKQDIESQLSTAQTVAEQLTAQLSKIALLEDEVDSVKLERARLTEELSRMTIGSQEAEATVQKLTDQLNKISSKMSAGEAESLAASKELEQVGQQLAEVESEKEKLIEALEVQAKNTEDAVRSADEEVQRLKAEMAVVVSEKKKLAQESDAQLERISTLENELRIEKAAAHDSLNAVNVDVEKLVIESAELKYEKQKLEKALSLAKEQLQEEVATLAAHIEKLEDDIKKLAAEKNERSKKVEEMSIEVQRLEGEIARMQTEKEAAETSLNGTIDSLKAERSHLQNAKDELAQKLKVSEDKLETQQANFISLQEEYYQMKIEKEDLEQSMAIADQNLQLSHKKIAGLLEDHAKFKSESSSSYEQARGDFERSDRELKLVADEKEKLGNDLSSLSKVVENLEADLQNIKTNGQTKLNAATEQIKQLETKCGRLESEIIDLEEVLASTNEMAQTVKAEFYSLSSSAEELSVLKAERKDMEQHLSVLKEEKKDLEQLLIAAEESIEAVTAELKKLEGEKSELEHDLALAQVTWKSQLFEANELVASVRAELALAVKSKQLVEEQLSQSFYAKAELQYQVKAAEHEASQLQEKTRNLELELGQEREAAKNAKIELENLQYQLSTRPEHMESENATSSMASEAHEGFAAKLDECHRAILSLGQQLHSMTTSRSSPSMTEQAISEESIGTLPLMKDETADSNTAAAAAAAAATCDDSQSKETAASASELVESIDGKVFVPSIPLEGRPRSKSTSSSPGKPKHSSSRNSANSSDLSKSLDMGSPSDKPSSSSSGFSRFFRGKSSSSSSHHHS